MKNKTKSSKNENFQSDMTIKLIFKYFLSLTAYGIFLIFAVVLCAIICSQFIWQPNDPMYRFLKFIQYNMGVSFFVVFITGWFFITYYWISKPFRHLSSVAKASDRLANPTTEPIVLPDELSYIENELNLVREKALNNINLAKEAEQRKNDLVVYLAHDLKTPLTSVIGYLTLLRDEKEISPELREKYLSIASDKAERLEELINEFFEITRFNLSYINLEYKSVNLTRMLEQLAYEFKPMLSEKNLTVRLDTPPDTVISIDVDKMQRVFDNLLRNALCYSYENTEIKITMTENENDVEISFVNHGKTISPEKLNRVFEQFYRLDNSRSTKSGGAGIGLAVAKEITEHHGGTIRAESQNEIIEFAIKLPKNPM